MMPAMPTMDISMNPEDTSSAFTSREKMAQIAHRPDVWILCCPNCGSHLIDHRCELRCPECRYFASCSDYY